MATKADAPQNASNAHTGPPRDRSEPDPEREERRLVADILESGANVLRNSPDPAIAEVLSRVTAMLSPWYAGDTDDNPALLAAVESIAAVFELQDHPRNLPLGFEALHASSCDYLPPGLAMLTGESSLCEALASRLATTGPRTAPLLYFSLQETGAETYFQLLAQSSRIDLGAMAAGRMPLASWERLTLMAARLNDRKFLRVHSPLNVDQLERYLRHHFQIGIGGEPPLLGRGRRCAGIIINLFPLPWQAGYRDGEPLTELAPRLKEIAAAIQVPVILLGRFPEMTTARLPDLVDPQLSRCFDTVLHLEYLDWAHDRKRVALSVIKHPAARMVTADIYFDRKRMAFEREEAEC